MARPTVAVAAFCALMWGCRGANPAFKGHASKGDASHDVSFETPPRSPDTRIPLSDAPLSMTDAGGDLAARDTAADSTCAGVNSCAPGNACLNGKCVSLLQGLVGHWKLDDGMGLVAHDSSGSGNDGMVIGGATWTDGGFAGAKFPNPYSLAFDGVDDTVIVPDPPGGTLDFGAASFTFAAWVYVTGATGCCDMPIYKGGASAGSAGFDVELGMSTWLIYVGDPTYMGFAQLSVSPILDQWVHVAGVRDARTGTIRAYLNGALADTQPGPPGSVSNGLDLSIGSESGVQERFQGKIDDVRIYDRALSTDEVAALYAGQ